ncbi:hypothetical protein ACEXQD_01180 [Herbiconiux sp. P15]|uniref:hypothetical protein n=1 Tax=Herbiconiux liukaitaii TaxID=3342799 RepID=UPI0035BA0812
MNNLDTCTRCEGSGADPRQAYFDDMVELCSECRGDGMVLSHEQIVHALELAGSRAA